MTSYGYARVSTIAQDAQAQVDALTAAGVDQVVVEHASGTRSDRPLLVELLGQLVEGDTVTVWRLDRLGRSTTHLVETVRELETRGVEFRSLSEHIDTRTPTGKLMLGLFALLAEFERDLIAERTAAGLAAARADGKTLGRRSKVNPRQVQHIHDLVRQGRSQRDIAALTGLSRAIVGRVVRNEIPSLAAHQPHGRPDPQPVESQAEVPRHGQRRPFR
ncbi:recombinase family protein [Luteipulveratus flavus]|uniref:Recombinase family protein n=1 Tax=Luteipulveratus flavus TaxID=3031728 RepID=A0ABT6C302_9MICO|nr:recombinase family protein [Luteipulveratus sp. YIM 133296]MDF8263210.1 recombinase family protein [Luteipulveratus sp. YIM 133296]